ncbi:DsbA family oxidoreductase [Streptomyces gobiensis]|uniref:DsbA family oxidoreductase n=1 Tax=Streptomyces gobiensis TaxID=2875706 RepID=UPI001E284D05|nr:DsbA family oxidoreductase [Streptomyces gobiensis]UGY93009.1 DsbA family oxidoreductase [Streptomyces gobiensis]
MQIEIWSDILCPWCYIGRSRITKALAEFGYRDEVEVTWRSFELAPDDGAEPGPTAKEAMAGWMDPGKVDARVELISSEGTREGLVIRPDLSRPVGTLDAHRLLHLAAGQERGGEAVDALLEQLFFAYHTEARNIAEHGVLLDLADRAGLDVPEAKAVLAGDRYADAVRADERRGRSLGVSGVPSVVIDGRPPVSGVLPPEELVRHLHDARRAGA